MSKNLWGKDALNQIKRVKRPIIHCAADHLEYGATGELKAGLGVYNGNDYNENATIAVSLLAKSFNCLRDCVRWLIQNSRNKKGQSKVSVDEQSFIDWGE